MRRKGSTLSDKQVAFTVKDGRRVTMHGPGLPEPVMGYVYGSDDYHWAVVTPDLETWLVHKTASAIQLHGDPTLDIEPKRDDILRLVRPYREHVLRSTFGQQSDTRQRSGE